MYQGWSRAQAGQGEMPGVPRDKSALRGREAMSILCRHPGGVLRPAEERDRAWCTSQNCELKFSDTKRLVLSARRLCRLVRIAGARPF